ncbi:H(+)/Cl(-) exchange transporter ClcA [Synechocystis sp. PCC 7339]|uniref:H(+)/Cl(-) exchange transporter ClcA n=1 Tax=Synechocystis sp. PCC 7339 TaxID=2782213 RepID=UPI001CBE98B7|nr:H(+)/Cl(-) exchange transporter ClcA [Synechocystis sp. PCC 7339]UAJ74283.1 H(+)/Cl(-) exchange transporter ClcA [Synechocystis sp. PCC 7339]
MASHFERSNRRWLDRLPRNLTDSARSLHPRTLLAAIVVGLITGAVGAGFKSAVNNVLQWRSQLASLLSPIPPLAWLVTALVSGGMVALSFWLMKRFAPDTSGSGIPQIEGHLDGKLPLIWQRVLPIKLVGGFLSLGAGMLAGFEGPTIQMGGGIGQMIGSWLKSSQEHQRILIAVGAGAGLATAFNAPLAGMALIGEEMRPRFRSQTLAYHGLLFGCVMATIVLRMIRGQSAIISLTQFKRVPLDSLWMFIILGILFGVMGYAFNWGLFKLLDWFDLLPPLAMRWKGFILGSVIGILSLLPLPLTNGGDNAVLWAFNSQSHSSTLILVFCGRFLLTLICYGSGAIGGIFAPMLGIASIASVVIARHFHLLFPAQIPEPAVMAIAGMGALVAATVRAPLTAILLTIEMTDNYFVILPLLVTCLVASVVAEGLGGKPIYAVLLERTLAKQNHG